MPSHEVNTLYLDTIMKQTEPQSLQDVAATTGSMLEELDGMAEALTCGRVNGHLERAWMSIEYFGIHMLSYRPTT